MTYSEGLKTTIIRHPSDKHVMSTEELVVWANTVHHLAGGKGNPFSPSDIIQRQRGFNCNCGTDDGTRDGMSLGDFTLVHFSDESIREGGKAYMQCSKCGGWSHL